MNKQQYVKQAKQTRPHTCHWPGCKKQVKPAFWGCAEHWRRLPQILKWKIWAAYRPGQEEDLNVSKEYMKVADEVQEWIEQTNYINRVKK